MSSDKKITFVRRAEHQRNTRVLQGGRPDFPRMRTTTVTLVAALAGAPRATRPAPSSAPALPPPLRLLKPRPPLIARRRRGAWPRTHQPATQETHPASSCAHRSRGSRPSRGRRRVEPAAHGVEVGRGWRPRVAQPRQGESPVHTAAAPSLEPAGTSTISCPPRRPRRTHAHLAAPHRTSCARSPDAGVLLLANIFSRPSPLACLPARRPTPTQKRSTRALPRPSSLVRPPPR